MHRTFLEAVAHRRSVYTLDDDMPVGRERVEEIVSEALRHTPTTFNCQGGRAAVLFGDHHRRLWQLVLETLRPLVAAEEFGRTAAKIAGFEAAAGTVLTFEEQAAIEELQERYPIYADRFPLFSQHSAGMLQYIIWTGLEDEGFGCSLQHYNPLIDEAVRREWHLPDSWELTAQLVFGRPTAWAPEKQFRPVAERIRLFS